jgi:hypothetical protein
MEAAVNACQALAPIADLVLEIGNLKNFTVAESPGGFHTPKNIPLQSATLRTQSSGLLYLVKWFRGLVLVPPGFVIIHADFKAEEMHIAAVRSGDEGMLKAVAEDPHLKLGIEAGLIPTGGDAKEHRAERAKAKIANFRILYGSGGEGLAKLLKCSAEQGYAVLDTHKRLYPRYWDGSRSTRWQRARRVTMNQRRLQDRRSAMAALKHQLPPDAKRADPKHGRRHPARDWNSFAPARARRLRGGRVAA